jgi:hypothetical protein
MPRRSDVASRLPVVIGYNRFEAAAAVGVSATTFDAMVAAGVMPQPKIYGKRRIWKVDELYAAFDALPREGGESEPDTWADFR